MSELGWPPTSSSGRELRGRGAVVGIVDVEFDPISPFFGASPVVVWDQTATAGGHPHPSGLGRVFQTPAEWSGRFSAAGGRWSDIEHGTVVGAIGAGRTPPGFAPEADLMAVVVETFERIPEAVRWIFDNAAQADRPAVVNLSLRRDHFEPHDGSDVVSQELDRLTGPGRLLVAAAGNEGTLVAHARLQFDGPGEQRIPLASFGGAGPRSPGRVAIYSRGGEAFRLRLLAVDESGAEAAVTEWIEDGEEDDALRDGWWCQVSNGSAVRPGAAAVQVFAVGTTEAAHWTIQLDADSPTVIDLWCSDNFCEFWERSREGLDPTVEGADRHNMVASPGVARSVLTVGALDADGRLADFSNWGPSVDGRAKPEVVAPGCGLTLGSEDDLEGTSYAAPMVAGILACALELDPGLDPVRARALLERSSEPLDDPESEQGWGFGKVSASPLASALAEINP